LQRLIIFTTDPVFSCIRPACVHDLLQHKPFYHASGQSAWPRHVHRLFFSLFPRSIYKSRLDARAELPSYRGYNTRTVPATMGEYNARFRCTNRLWAVIQRRRAQQLLFTYKHILVYRAYAYLLLLLLFFYWQGNRLCTSIVCECVCNDDNMSARPMGSRTCLIIRSYGNYLGTQTHTHTHCRLAFAYTTDP